VCSETCVGRIRYLGVLLYDADRIKEAASVANEEDLYQAQLDIFLDPHDPEVIRQAREDGVPDSWIEAAQRSPVYKMAVDWKVAFPLHPEYRTLPMVWYVPPLSPVQAAADAGRIGSDGLIPDVESLRIPVKYLANLLTGGDERPVIHALRRLLAMRVFKRSQTVDGEPRHDVLEQVGLNETLLEDMYQTMAIANYEDRFVIPTNHRELGTPDPYGERSGCGFSFGDGCHTHGVTRSNLFGSKSPRQREHEPAAKAAGGSE
jgi:nitrate reductase beta subunit